MSLNKDPELKHAVLELPQKEKDKLLVRLVGRDRVLMNQLHFQLLENESDLEDRVERALKELQTLFKRLPGHVDNSNQHRNANALVSELKYGSGIVNEHATTTKDKLSEIQLRLFLIMNSFKSFDKAFAPHPYGHNDKLLNYQAARLKYVLGKFEKLHEDFQFEYRDELNEALGFAYQSGMRKYMEALGLPNEV